MASRSLTFAVLASLPWLVIQCGDSINAVHDSFVLETDVDLFNQLSKFEARDGYPNHTKRWFYLNIHEGWDLDVDDARLAVAPQSTIASPTLSFHPNARLEYGVRLDAFEAGGTSKPEGEFRCQFEVLLEPEGSKELIPLASTTLEEVTGPERNAPHHEVVRLPAEVARGRLVFRTDLRTAAGKPARGVLPTWWSPILISDGIRDSWSSRPLTVEELVLDVLLAPNVNVETPGPWKIVSEHRVAFDRSFPKGGAHPAAVFEQDATLEFSHPAGDEQFFTFRTSAQGDTKKSPIALDVIVTEQAIETRFQQIVSEDPATQGFESWEIPLPVRSSPTRSVKMELKTGNRAVIGLAEPRIVRRSRVPRQLSSPIDSKRPNIVLVVTETLRADETPLGGSSLELMPTLARLAREGRAYTAAQSSSSWTATAMASVLTGLYPKSHGVTSVEQTILVQPIQTLAETVSRAGITTVAFISNGLVNEGIGFAQGFEDFVIVGGNHGRVLNCRLEHWLKAHPGLQFFAYLHYFEPHAPYAASGELRSRYVPEELRGRWSAAEVDSPADEMVRRHPESAKDWTKFLRGCYRGEVAATDAALADLLKVLERAGVLENTVLIFTADHGEEFFERGSFYHGFHLHEEAVRVPLVIWGPRFISPAVVKRPVSTVSLAATICELLSIPVSGTPMRPALPTSEDGKTSEPLYSSIVPLPRSRFATPEPSRNFQALRSGNWKLIVERNGTLPPQLYDLAEDPGEKVNRFGLDPKLDQELMQQLDELVASLADPIGPFGAQLRESDRLLLEQLGYVDPTPIPPDKKPDR